MYNILKKGRSEKFCILELGNDSKCVYLDCFKYVLSETSEAKLVVQK